MKLQIEGNGSFGSFLKELLSTKFKIVDNAHSVILAVPISAYEECSKKHSNKHLINVCSVQKPSTDIVRRFSKETTSIHPLFGRRTPSDKRTSILTALCLSEAEQDFLDIFKKISNVTCVLNDRETFTPEKHDKLMARTHLKAVQAAQLIKPFVTETNDIPDNLIPNSFRLLRDFVKTLDDMPQGTLESILANPYNYEK